MEFKIKYIPLGLFCAFAIKMLVWGSSLQEAPILLILGALSAVYEIKFETKAIKMVENRIQNLEKATENTSKEISEIKTFVGGIKLGQNIRTVSMGK